MHIHEIFHFFLISKKLSCFTLHMNCLSLMKIYSIYSILVDLRPLHAAINATSNAVHSALFHVYACNVGKNVYFYVCGLGFNLDRRSSSGCVRSIVALSTALWVVYALRVWLCVCVNEIAGGDLTRTPEGEETIYSRTSNFTLPPKKVARLYPIFRKPDPKNVCVLF